ncbi:MULTISPECIES: sensor histidine kinase [unclassified Pedobacter]|uniref:sensor histidine kinase n=1 Tax=unclassified Pedobacter TaxID=2628915 RepID=UPI0014211F02|nr:MULTISPECIES: histidine kinase [unclassified Pedobacter]NII83738.1 sensor histidine kinase YesM [Pedobacter sp. SG908]NMN37595.1 sensor histidine kinase YesM [Pedobacter sp. SG918]
MDKNERRISWYSSLLIALLVNTPKLLALREKGIVAQYWHFNPFELLYQFLFNLFFCGLIFHLNLTPSSKLYIYRERHKTGLYVVLNVLIFLFAVFLGGVLQNKLFLSAQLPRIYIVGNFVRLFLSSILTGILIKIILLVRAAKNKEVENEQLKVAYMQTELELLKEQMNPHFLFNSLSSLSGVIRENPALAQKYVRDLSTVFRYALNPSKNNLVTLHDELKMLKAFAQLVTMRLENAFKMEINIPDEVLNYKLPHLTLQPLLENAVKHNAATFTKPLIVKLYIYGDFLVLSNNLNEIPRPESSNGMGLANLNERFKIMVKKEIEISKSQKEFLVKIPLKA